MPRLVLEIEIPDYSGDDPALNIGAMNGQIVGFKVLP